MPVIHISNDGFHLRKHVAEIGHDPLDGQDAAGITSYVNKQLAADPTGANLKGLVVLLSQRSVIQDRKIAILIKQIKGQNS